MITSTSSRRRRPQVPDLLPVAARGILTGARHTTEVSAKTSLFDNFESGLDQWVNVHGRLDTLNGDVIAAVSIFDPITLFDYGAGYHRTELLSDNQRAKITIQGGTIQSGKARIVICADPSFRRYYGLEIETGISNNRFHIIKGFSPIDVKKFATVNRTVANGASAEVWMDWETSTIRAYYNGAQVTSLPVPAYEIQHGPGHRKTGVVMGVDWVFAPGVQFETFEAWDV